MKEEYQPTLAQVSINIDEMDAILAHHWELYDFINKLPKEKQDQITKAGWSLRETGQKRLRRYRELDEIKQTTWPK